MKLIDEKGKQKQLIMIIISIPVVFIFLYFERGRIGKTEVFSATFVILMAFVIRYFINKRANK